MALPAVSYVLLVGDDWSPKSVGPSPASWRRRCGSKAAWIALWRALWAPTSHRVGSKVALLGPEAWCLGQGVPKVGMEKSLGSMVTSCAGRTQVREKSNTSCHAGWLH